MRLVARLLGGLLVLVALVILGRDLMAIANDTAEGLAPLGPLWYLVDAASLDALRSGVERHLSPRLWDYLLAPLLLWPASLVIGIPGLLLLFFSRAPRLRRSNRFRR